MELYILDELLRRVEVIDRFESLIWTERYSSIGDFQLVIHSTNESRSLLKKGTKLAINESFRVMVIDTIENKDDSEGRSMLTVTGSSLESILMDRVARSKMSSLGDEESKWYLSGTPGDIARHVFTKICVEGLLAAEDKIPFLKEGSLLPTGNIPESKELISVELGLSSVYDVVKQLCDTYNLGFRLIRNFDRSELYFDIYSGTDLTSRQSSKPPVVFSKDLDNLVDTTELSSTADVKNVAYVFSRWGTQVVYAPGVPASISGFDRKILYLEVTDIDAETPADQAQALVRQRGIQALSEHRSLYALDGEISQANFHLRYELGDIVEMRNRDAVTSHMRVTERIFASDAQGDRSYPTLGEEVFITPGSWLAWNPNEDWVEVEGEWRTV